MRATCRSTGIYVDQCAHCPTVAAGLPEPVVARRDTLGRAERVLTERLRARLIGRGRSEWFSNADQWAHCALCRRPMADGDPVRFLYGRTAKDMCLQGWCCEALDRDEVKARLKRAGYATDNTVADRPADTAKPAPRRGMLGS